MNFEDVDIDKISARVAAKKAEITGDEFFSVAINAVNGSVEIAGKKLLAAGKEIKTVNAVNSEIG